jgi:hypothetical protein
MALNFPPASAFFRLPIAPENGFPQAFTLDFNGKLYTLTLRVSFLTLEPFKVWEAGSHLSAERLVRRSLDLPLNTAGARVPLPWEVQGEPERQRYVLPQEELYLTVTLDRQNLPAELRRLEITRPVIGIPFRLGDLQFLFQKIIIARGNLLGPGEFGSEVVAGVKVYDG